MSVPPLTNLGYIATLRTDPRYYEPNAVRGYQFSVFDTVGGDDDGGGGGGSTRPTSGMIYPRGQG